MSKRVVEDQHRIVRWYLYGTCPVSDQKMNPTIGHSKIVIALNVYIAVYHALEALSIIGSTPRTYDPWLLLASC
jgi:hypothetical protein